MHRVPCRDSLEAMKLLRCTDVSSIVSVPDNGVLGILILVIVVHVLGEV